LACPRALITQRDPPEPRRAGHEKNPLSPLARKHLY
jgi:hypothetical protein